MKYNIARSIEINAPLSAISPLVGDLSKWNEWSPWTVLEPDHKRTGSKEKMSWDGEIIGSGNMTLLSSEDEIYTYDLQFLKPFKSQASVSMILFEENGKTQVTWTMDSSMPWFLFFMVRMMKSWIEMDYDRGLNMLKSLIETGSIPAKTEQHGVVPFEGFDFIGIKKTSSMEDMPNDMEAAFEQLHTALQKNNIEAKHWVATYPKVDMKTKMFTYIAAASSENVNDTDLGSDFVKGSIHSQNMFRVSHLGSYRFLGNAWSMGMSYVRAQKLKGKGDPFEYYYNSPKETDEKDLKTDIYMPVK